MQKCFSYYIKFCERNKNKIINNDTIKKTYIVKSQGNDLHYYINKRLS